MADLTKTITYNDLSLNTATFSAGGAPMSGYLVDDFDPWGLELAAYMEKRALQDGLDASTAFLGRRSISMIVTAYGSTRGDFWDKAQDLLAAFSPTLAYNADTANLGFLPFDFYQPTADISTWPLASYADGIPLRYYLRPVSIAAAPISRSRLGGTDAQGVSERFRVSLVARDPRKYMQTTRSAAITVSNNTAPHRGDYPVFPIITYSMTATGHSALSFTVDGLSVFIDMSSTSSGNFTLNFADRTFVNFAGATAVQVLGNASFAQIQPGGTVYSMTNGTGLSSPLITYREAFA